MLSHGRYLTPRCFASAVRHSCRCVTGIVLPKSHSTGSPFEFLESRLVQRIRKESNKWILSVALGQQDARWRPPPNWLFRFHSGEEKILFSLDRYQEKRGAASAWGPRAGCAEERGFIENLHSRPAPQSLRLTWNSSQPRWLAALRCVILVTGLVLHRLKWGFDVVDTRMEVIEVAFPSQRRPDLGSD